MSKDIMLDLLKKHKGIEVNKSKKATKVERLIYRNLSVDEFGKSDIPDEYFSACKLTALRNGYSYDFTFSPASHMTQMEYEGKIYKVLNAPKVPASVVIVGQGEKDPGNGVWKMDKKGLEKTVKDFLTLIPVGKIMMDDDPQACACGLHSPQMDMTQKSIAEVARKINDELKFFLTTVRLARYHDIVPKDRSSKGMGFNLPAGKIWIKEWNKVYE